MPVHLVHLRSIVLSLALTALVAGCSSSETTSDAVAQHDSNDGRDGLLALGYLEANPIASEDQGRIGVEFRDTKLSTPAYQLLTEKRRIRLIDMDGNVVREATADGLQATFFSEAEYLSDGTASALPGGARWRSSPR